MLAHAFSAVKDSSSRSPEPHGLSGDTMLNKPALIGQVIDRRTHSHTSLRSSLKGSDVYGGGLDLGAICAKFSVLAV